MRARYPECEGTVRRDGVEIHYERYGSGTPTVLLLPTWSLVHSRHWKLQIPYLSRHFSVVCFDGRGNGRSDRPSDPAAYDDVEFVSDAVAVMDATATERAVLVSVSQGALWALALCAEHPDQVLGSVFVAPSVGLAPEPADRRVQRFEEVIKEPVGWQKYNACHWKTDYLDFVDFFVGQMFTEPHSTKQIDDAVGWALETDGVTLVATDSCAQTCASTTVDLAMKVTCPVLVIHGTHDAIASHADGEVLAERTGGVLVTLRGAGHFPHARDPVQVNRLIKSFVDGIGQ